MTRALLALAILAASATAAWAQEPVEPTPTTPADGDTPAETTPAEAAGDDAAGIRSPGDVVADETKDTKDEWDRATPEFDKLRTPDSPAFTILGVSPTEIQRPSTPKALAASLQAFTSDGGVVIPKNLALEVAPYWLFAHPELTIEEYDSNGPANLYRTLSFSIATRQTEIEATDTTPASTDSTLAFGFRSQVVKPASGERCEAIYAKVEKVAADVSEALAVPEAKLEELAKLHGRNTPAFNQALQLALQEGQAAAETELAAVQTDLAESECGKPSTAGHGFGMDVAGALALDFPGSVASSENADLVSGAAWSDLSYMTRHFTFLLLLRYTWRQVDVDDQSLLDLGGRLVYKRDDYALSAEGVYRGRLAGPGDDHTSKVALAVEYSLVDGTWVTVSFGKDFTIVPGQAGNLFSLANLSWSFGKPTIQ